MVTVVLMISTQTEEQLLLDTVLVWPAGTILTDINKLMFPKPEGEGKQAPRIPKLIISKDDMQLLKQGAKPGDAQRAGQSPAPCLRVVCIMHAFV